MDVREARVFDASYFLGRFSHRWYLVRYENGEESSPVFLCKYMHHHLVYLAYLVRYDMDEDGVHAMDGAMEPGRERGSPRSTRQEFRTLRSQEFRRRGSR